MESLFVRVLSFSSYYGRNKDCSGHHDEDVPLVQGRNLAVIGIENLLLLVL